MPSWTSVAHLSDIPSGTARQVEAAGRLIAVFNVNGSFFALRDECTHAGAPLSEGKLKNHAVTCPWHAAVFDVRTGQSTGDAAYNNVRSYPTRIVGEDIQIEI